MNKQRTSKKLLAGLLLGGFACATVAHADLVNNGGGLIYDTDLNITWISDGNYADTSGAQFGGGTMNWSRATSWAEGLNFQHVSGWQLPTEDQLNHLFYDELGGQAGTSIVSVHNPVNYALFENIKDLYWSSTETNSSVARYINFHSGYSGNDNKPDGLYAFAVHTGNVPAVPEPETYAMLLAGLGLVGFITRRRKQIS
jgi:hypothetical protein